MPRSFLIKKSERAEKKSSSEDTLLKTLVRDSASRRPASLTEPLMTAMSPFTPLVQPLAVRLYNGYIHDVLSALPYYDPLFALHHARMGSTPSPIDYHQPRDYSKPRETDLAHQQIPLTPSPRKAEEKEKEESEDEDIDVDIDDEIDPVSEFVENQERVGAKPGRESSGGRKSVNNFQDGVTVGYTYDAFFISDGRSRRRNQMGIPEQSRTPQKYTCNECGKQYATSSNLSRHKQTHRSLDSQQAKRCPHCDKVYVSMPALSMHILTHSLKHTCSVCNKSFSRPWLLQGHLRSHSGEKPYGCAHCGKAFADRSNLRAHMQTHSAYKHYKCKRCNKSFALKSYLNKHYESSCFKDDMSMVSSCSSLDTDCHVDIEHVDSPVSLVAHAQIDC